MIRIYILIFMFYILNLFLACKVHNDSADDIVVMNFDDLSQSGNTLAPSQLPPIRYKYPQANVVYDQLMKSLYALKSSYSENRDAFLSVKLQFDNGIFGIYDMDFSDDEAKDDVYGSLKYNSLIIANLKRLIETLISANHKDIALILLYRLSASAIYVREVIDEDYGIFSQDNLSMMRCSNNITGINLIKSYLDEMLKLQNTIVDEVKNMLSGAIDVINDNDKFLLKLNLITGSQGYIREMINGLKSLRYLRVALEEEFDNLKLCL
ncbi:hypothetical protein ACE4V3_05125 (plasmid) [Borrelia recurrentis]|uniref:Lipoprotein n=1 Tax=Borrelia recurrentis (strain A1) TaxID=412418 RepID=B5RRU7_BORRA|nr:hypothetical protein [Borrelia recurrentis]ACH95083.1 putative lipoprotein [Borrelia recurrentis A1]